MFKKTSDQLKAIRMLGGKSRYVLLFGGSRSGKTFVIVYSLLVRALRTPGSRHAIMRLRGNAVRQSVRLDTLPKVIALAFPGLCFKESAADGFITLPNGSEIWFCGLDSDERVDKILGKEFATLYFNECSEISFDAVSTALTRLAQRTKLVNRAWFDCNPAGKKHWSYQLFVAKKDPVTGCPLKFPGNYSAMMMNPAGNRDNLPNGYLEQTLAGLPEKQRKRFLEGVFQEETDGALWTPELLSRCRAAVLPEMERLVVGVDPAVTSGADSDLTGIITAGRSHDGRIFIIDDASCRGKPAEWGRRVIERYMYFQCDRVVGEVNNGGDLIESLLKSLDPDISFRAVRASRGKIARAEPVAALYEQGKVFHLGEFRELEDEMCSFVPGTLKSPDRLDAMVWAVSELTGHGAGQRFVFA